MAKKKAKKKSSPSSHQKSLVKVVIGLTSPTPKPLAAIIPPRPLALEQPPPIDDSLLKESTSSEDDAGSVSSSSDHQSSSSEEFSSDEDSVDEDSSSSESESNVHYHKAANSAVKHAVKPSDSSSCPKLKFYAKLSAADECTLLVEDLDVKCAMWKTCLIRYVSGKFPGYKALNAVIVNSFHCKAVLTLHESGWLIYKFKNEDDKLVVLQGGPYLVFGRPLMLREMPEFFNFNSAEMSTIPVWVKLPNLPLRCWSENCLSKIASVIGNPNECDMLTSSMTRLSYARVLVEIDFRKKLHEIC
ncbi:hypothetical protein OIU76_030636 [Salix suchowensis]|nr:hypothetical protein OIU76_030636 [Salix suchowensis]